jgi:predicted RNA binding protein YcfA (HicA-like mRNA interferase family)
MMDGIWSQFVEVTGNTNIPIKKGRVTIAGKSNHDLAPGTINSIYKQSGLKER